MHRHFKAGLAAAACLLAVGAARADDADLDVFGPVSRSSIALYDEPQSFRNTEVQSGTGIPMGATRAHDNLVSLSGVWAINPRWNVTAEMLDDVSSQNTFTFGSDRRSVSHTGVGEQLDVSTWLMGDARVVGAGLAATAAVVRRIGDQNRWYAQLQPQVRTSDSLVATAVLEIEDAFEHGSGAVETAGLYASWHATPELSLVPGVAIERFAGHNTYSSYEDRWASLSATWHVDRDWAVSVEGEWMWQTNIDTAHFSNSIRGGHGVDAEIGVRRYF